MKRRNIAKTVAALYAASSILSLTTPVMAEEEVYEGNMSVQEETAEAFESAVDGSGSEEEVQEKDVSDESTGAEEEAEEAETEGDTEGTADAETEGAAEDDAKAEEEEVMEEDTEEAISEEDGENEENADILTEDDVQGEGNVITLGECTAQLSDTSGGAEVTVSANNFAAVTIKKAGDYTITGSGSNVYISVKKEITGVNITLDNVTLDNSGLYEKLGSDEASIAVKAGAQAKLILSGESVITSPSKCKKEIESVLKASSSTLTIDGSGTLTMVSPDASAISAKYGRVNIENGTLNINDCGDDAIKAKGGAIYVDGGVLNIDSCKGDCLKAKADSESTADLNGYVYINGGDLNFTKCGDNGIQAEFIYVTGGNLDIETWYANAATAYYVNGQYTAGSSDTAYNYIWKSSGMGGMQMAAVSDETETEGAPGGFGGGDLPVSGNSGMPGGGMPGGEMPGNPGNGGMGGGQSEVKYERINIDLGSHKGLKAGTKAATETFTDPEDSEGSTVSDIVTESSGGVFISGGTINIDTSKSGLKANSLGTTVYRPDGVIAYSKAQGQDTAYIVGAPDDGIKSQNVVEISGGSLTINSSDDGISAANTVTISGTADVNVTKAYEGVEASEINIGTYQGTDSPKLTVTTCDDGLNASGKTLVYTYDSYTGYEEDDEVNYVKQSTSVAGNKCNLYSGKLTVNLFSGTKTAALPNGSYESLKNVSYGSNGDGVDCNGTFSMYGGEAYVYNNSGNSESPIDQDSGFYYYGGTLLGAGYSGMGNESVPEYGTGKYFTVSKSFSADSLFTVKNGDTQIYSGTIPCSGSFIIFGSDALGSSISYTLGNSSGTASVTTLNNAGSQNPGSGSGSGDSGSTSGSGSGSESGSGDSGSTSGSGSGSESGSGDSGSSSGSGSISENGTKIVTKTVTNDNVKYEISYPEILYYTGAKITLEDLSINGAKAGEKLNGNDIIFSRVKYKNNKNAGTAYATPVLKAAKGADSGTRKAVKSANAYFKSNPIEFTIKERPLADMNITGRIKVKSADKATLSLAGELNGRSLRLKLNRDYKVKSIDEASKTVTIEGIGNYTGTAVKAY